MLGNLLNKEIKGLICLSKKKKSHYNIISSLKTIIILALIYSKLKLINHYFESQQKQNRQFFFLKRKQWNSILKAPAMVAWFRIDPTTNLLMSQSLAVEADRRGESPPRTIEGKQLIHIASIHIVYGPVCPHTLL